MSFSRLHLRRQRHRGVIFITALGVIVVLSGLVLVFAQSMRTEAIASANRMSYIQADAVEQGAEKWVLAQVEANRGDAVTITQVPAEGIQVGNGYFWILRPNPDSDQQYSFGIADESAKLNINRGGEERLLGLPNMTQDVADSIINWRGSQQMPNGADSSYYDSLPVPYDLKGAPFETVEELMLIKDMTPEMLYGFDLNRNGVIEPAEAAASNGSAMFGNTSTTDTRGIFNYVTIYSVDPNTTNDGQRRVNINGNGLRNALTQLLGQQKASQYMSAAGFGGRGRAPQYNNIGDFYTASGMARNTADIKLVADHLTTTRPRSSITGLINVATAPKQVLMTIPGLQESDADSIIGARSGADTSTYAWLFDAIPSRAASIVNLVASRSYQYSADIVAVSGDGRSFKRVRIVVDDKTPPAQILYRRELTSLGWPLPADLRTSLRAGHGVPAEYQQTSNTVGF